MAKKLKNHDQAWQRQLADLLIARHLNVSIPDHEQRRTMLAEAEKTWKRTEKKTRCIAVVGAGASAPFLERGNKLAKSLIQQFHIDEAAVQAERERLERITAVDPHEFEAQLAAIGQTLGGDRRVRNAISDLYEYRHPTIEAYEMIAHLLKHRFLDAVISMNFDELLDQSLDDELGVGEYQRIVSDRDCVDVQSNVHASDYIPLYIKLHGTASEPESLRFTRESYYNSPIRVSTVAAELFQIPECVVVNVGFGMGSFDLHRLLAMPDKLWLFNLSLKRLDIKAIKAIRRERRPAQKKKKKKKKKKKCPEAKKSYRKGKPKFRQRKEGKPKKTSDKLLDELLEAIEERGGELVESAPSVVSLRTVTRHDAVVRLLGPSSGPGRRLIELPRNADDARISIDPQTRAAKPDTVYAGYLRRRAILELALALARGRGLVSVGALAVDRGGHYYDAYKRLVGKTDEPSTWRDLYTLVGFEQNKKVPDVFRAAAEIRKRPNACDMDRDDWRELPKIDLKVLARRVLPHVVDSPSPQDFKAFETALDGLYKGTEYELHSRDDRICAKTFTNPLTLKTISALDAYTYHLIKQAKSKGKSSEVDIISETGDWLLPLASQLHGVGRVRLIVAFSSLAPKLRKKFRKHEVKQFEMEQLQPWHHNRHMVILRQGGEPHSALYYARHHRTPYVTPVFVNHRLDIEVLETTFKDRWKSAKRQRKVNGRPKL